MVTRLRALTTTPANKKTCGRAPNLDGNRTANPGIETFRHTHVCFEPPESKRTHRHNYDLYTEQDIQ